MIALILGTTEGKNIVHELNKFTEDILISTATEYGGELLNNYVYKFLNTKALDFNGLKKMLIEHNVSVLVDASHPYATEITKNCIEICSKLKIDYLRYERPAVSSKYRDNEKVIFVKNYEALTDKIKTMEQLNKNDVTILNTTGSRNIEKFVKAQLSSRIVHRVLPSLKVMEQCLNLKIKVEDIIAIKGPIGLELNKGFIKQYDAKAIILKDSGLKGGTEEKIQAGIEECIYVFVIEREEKKHANVFYNEKHLVDYIQKNNLYRSI